MHALTPLFILFNFSTPNRDNEHSPEITQNSIVFPRASLSFEPQQAQSQSIIFFTIYTYIRNEVCVDIASTCRKHAPSSANVELMVANLSSTSCPVPGPTGHSSFASGGDFFKLGT